MTGTRPYSWRPTHTGPGKIEWYDTGEPGFRLVLDPSLDQTYREAVLSTEIEILRERIRKGSSKEGQT